MHDNLHIEQKLSLMFIIFRRGFACEIKTDSVWESETFRIVQERNIKSTM